MLGFCRCYSPRSGRSSGGGAVYSGYDGLNRQLWRSTTSDGSNPYVTYSYDSTTGGNHGIGRLTGETFTGGTTAHPLTGSYAYTYDARGQQTQVTTTVGGTSSPLGYTYDDAGHPTSLTYSDGEVLHTSYSSTGWVNRGSLKTANPQQSREEYAVAWGMDTSTHPHPYSTTLTDAEWALVEPLLPAVANTGRPRKHALRTIVDAIFYAVRAGHAWRVWAALAPRMATWENRLPLLSPVAAGWHLGAPPHRAARNPPRSPGP